MPFTFIPAAIDGVFIIATPVYPDHRGFFAELFQAEAFRTGGLPDTFVQDNFSFSHRYVLRGLHYQMNPYAQGKLITVLSGEIFDCAVDIRKGSPSYGKWIGFNLRDSDGRLLYVPPGLAHGFCVLSESAVVMYKVTARYQPAAERGIRWNDPQLGIDWPVDRPLLSPKDDILPPLIEAENNFTYP